MKFAPVIDTVVSPAGEPVLGDKAFTVADSLNRKTIPAERLKSIPFVDTATSTDPAVDGGDVQRTTVRFKKLAFVVIAPKRQANVEDASKDVPANVTTVPPVVLPNAGVTVNTNGTVADDVALSGTVTGDGTAASSDGALALYRNCTVFDDV